LNATQIQAAVAIIDCILFIGVQKYPFHTLPSRCLAKVYANTLMVILNSRIRITGSRDESKLNLSVINNGSSDLRFASMLSKQNNTTSEDTASSSRSDGGIASRIQYSRHTVGERMVPLEEMGVSLATLLLTFTFAQFLTLNSRNVVVTTI
jgi:hypothetical protein